MEQRRHLLKAAAGGAVMVLSPAARVARAQGNPRELRPQEGDRLVYADGDQKGQPVVPASLPLGGPPVNAYAQDAASGAVRASSRPMRASAV